MSRLKNTLLIGLTSLGLAGCERGPGEHTMEVTASAYTMAEDETKKGNVGLAAWGDQLEPGMKAIAVSRDLIDEGLGHGTKVEIEGLEGEFVVLDKMNKRWDEKIDIFMGTDKEAAREWGKRTVEISWVIPEEE